MALVAHDRLARRPRRHGGSQSRWPTGFPKGTAARLRRGRRLRAGIPLNLVQKWLGHAQLTTTAIYADAIGAQEKDIARRMWG